MNRFMYRTIFHITVLLSFTSFSFVPPASVFAGDLSEVDLSYHFEEKLLGSLDQISALAVDDEKLIISAAVLNRFYRQRVYRPAWWTENDKPIARVDVLLKILQDSASDGLNPEDYHLKKIKILIHDLNETEQNVAPFNIERIVDLDILLTDAFLGYGFHLLSGRINLNELYSAKYNPELKEWLLEPFLDALDQNDIETFLRNLAPAHPAYTRLKQALNHYRTIASNGGWPVITQCFKKGERHPDIAMIKTRLMISGDLKIVGEREKDIFDESLEDAIRNFQKRHGIKDHGILDKETIDALNISLDSRIRQMEINMERWHWMPHDLGKRHIIVNIPAFELDVLEEDKTIMHMRAILGKRLQRTPPLSSKINSVDLNPFWNIPMSIAKNEILPILKRDPDYLIREKIRIYRNWTGQARKLDPRVIPWRQITPGKFAYRLVQDPGPLNPLGRIKFLFPNESDVYIHDTPSKHLFQREVRAFSHGCIRIERPLELAHYLLQDNPRWSGKKIEKRIKKGKTERISIPEPIDTHIVYFTTWVEPEGTVQFRRDIYYADAILDWALSDQPFSAK
jgi:murein L,D-transpeptidase YcbB/YkuD